MNIMTKRGSQDNIITYEHICDTNADMVNIDPNYITLGSICVVINGEDEGMEVYMANSNKEWNSIAMGAGSGDDGSGASSLIDLLDVEVLNPTDGQTLTYDATAQKWINGGGSGGGNEMLVGYGLNEDTGLMYLDKTWQEIYDAVTNGINVFCYNTGELSWNKLRVCSVVYEDFAKKYDVFTDDRDNYKFACDAPDEYPNNNDS